MTARERSAMPCQLTMNQISQRITEIHNELHQLDPQTPDTVLLRKAFPLWVELDDLRERQFSDIGALHKEVMVQHSELLELSYDHEERLMQLEGIELTNQIATQFIIDRGLTEQFKEFMAEQVGRVSFDLGERPARLQ
ncbi:MAG: hypothetical protein JWM44_1299 [Bacilli bacterium]|nr:hypothetical protein [Bacilli bacterium]